jgi:hypothetical protein
MRPADKLEIPTDETQRAERARRVAAMLRRWEQEDVSDEPEWMSISSSG